MRKPLAGLSRKSDERNRVLAAHYSTDPEIKRAVAASKSGWLPRVRQPGEVPPPTTDKMRGTYNPAKHNPAAPTRPGALDFLKVQSKGYRT